MNWLRRLPGVPIWPSFSTILPKNRTGRADEERVDVLDEGCNRPAVTAVDVNDGVGLWSVLGWSRSILDWTERTDELRCANLNIMESLLLLGLFWLMDGLLLLFALAQLSLNVVEGE